MKSEDNTAAVMLDHIKQLITRWEIRSKDALPADAMLINKHIRELRETLQIIPSPLSTAFARSSKIGEIRSLGPNGPKYETGKPIRATDDGDWMIEITMVETGEKAEYRLTHLLDDPKAG